MSCLSTSMPFRGLFCLWEAWRRRSSCWRESEPVISSDATFLNISTSRAGRISWHLPGWWVCSIFVKACWRRTKRGKRQEVVSYQIKQLKYHKYFKNRQSRKYVASTLLYRICLFRNTHIEAIMGHIWRNCNIIVTHGFVDILIMFNQDSLRPHVLLGPSVQRDKAEWNQDFNQMSPNKSTGYMQEPWSYI